MEQRCFLWAVWLTWIGVPLLGLVVGLRLGWPTAAAAVAIAVAGQVVYIRGFRHVSKWAGYGPVEDAPAKADAVPGGPLPRVVVYTASVCPFCPIVKQRLGALQQRLGFELSEVDVTFRPEIIRAKGLRSVPVVEANGHVLVGNATSERLAAFLCEAATPVVAAR